MRESLAISIVAVLSAVGVAVSGCSGPGPSAPSTDAMAARLRRLVAEGDPAKQYTVNGHLREAALRREIAEAEDLSRRFVARLRLGNLLVNEGDAEGAIRALTELTGELQTRGITLTPGDQEIVHELFGLAYLRRAERQNCVARHAAESCLLPFEGAGIHLRRAASEQALSHFTELLRLQPDSLRYRWLYNFAHMTLGQYPEQVPSHWRIPPSVFASDYEIGRFVDVAPDAGVDAMGLAGSVVMDDLDGDGLLDLMVSDWGEDRQLRLFVNRGDGTFEDRTIEAGLRGEIGGLNLCQADYDNDGKLDVLVLRGAWRAVRGRVPNSLLRNTGDGTFVDATQAAGLLSFSPTQTAAWADYDGDGWIDLFIGNESTGADSRPCELFRNNGDGTFTDVAAAVGVDHTGFVKGVTWGDYDDDGRPDLYLSQFGQPNVLLRNEGPSSGGWAFRDVTAQARVAEPDRSFPTWFWDYDNDGREDLFVAPFAGFRFDGSSLDVVLADLMERPVAAPRARLYHNNGDGTFHDVAVELGLGGAMLVMGANYGDVDGDGFLDGYFGTGDPWPGTLVPNRMFRNDRGKRFQDVTSSGGFGHVAKGHGIAFGDIDNDGDEDVYAVMGGSAAGDTHQNVLFDNPGHGGHWLTLRLRGVRSNASAIGARIKVVVDTTAGPREIHRTVGSGGSFGASSLQQEVGLGDARAVKRIEIRWPGGELESFHDLPMDHVVRIEEGDSQYAVLGAVPFDLVRVPELRRARNRQELLPGETIEQLRRGLELFDTTCAGCHGRRGRGDGRVAAQLLVAPSDLSDPSRTAVHSDRTRLEIIRKGIPGTPMFGWEGILDDDDLHAVLLAMRYVSRPGASQ